MIEGSDFAQRTLFVNAFDDTLISEERRTVCYNQTIYEDQHVELDEYTGLTLGITVNKWTTVLTKAKPEYDQAAIFIIDNDSKFFHTLFFDISIAITYFFHYTGAEVGLELTSFTVSDSAGSVELCATVFSPSIQCPIQFPFPIFLTVSNSRTGMKQLYI